MANKNKKAKKILIELVRKYKDSYRAHRKLAHIYEKEGGMRKAINEYVHVLDIKKDDYDSYYRISVLLNDLGNKQEAVQMLSSLLKKIPQTTQASKLLAEIYMEQKEFKKAIEAYIALLKYQQDDYEIYYKLGICYSQINDFNVAKKCFQKTVEINKDAYNANYRLGQIWLLYRDFEQAEENFKKSLYNEKKAKSFFELAKIYIITNKKQQAISSVNNAIKLDSRYYEVSQREPVLFPIKKFIDKPAKKTTIPEYSETKQEIEIEKYLNDTYNLTKILNKQTESQEGIPKGKQE